MKKPFISAILLCGGLGLRMSGFSTPKQFLPLKGKPIALYSFDLFNQMDEIQEIAVVADVKFHSLFKERAFSKKIFFAEPGKRRQDSVQNALSLLDERAELVLVHDSARPFLTLEMVKKAIEGASLENASALGVKTKSTIRHCDEEGNVIDSPKRDLIFEMQTPQVVPKNTLLKGFEIAARFGIEVTDDVALAELAGDPVKIIEGDYQNFKITTKEDLMLAHALFGDLVP